MKNKLFLLLMVVFVCISGSMAYAEDEPERLKEAIINLSSFPDTLDPNKVSTKNGEMCILHLFEGLMKMVPDEEASFEDNSGGIVPVKVVPGQASSYEVSKDGRVYMFHLRDDIFWSDGKPVTAEDFVFSWRRLLHANNKCYYGSMLNGIVENAAEVQNKECKDQYLGIQAIDEKTLVIHLVRETPGFLELCASAELVPLRSDIINEYQEEWTDPEHIVTNGAYVLSRVQDNIYIKMRTNDVYYEDDFSGPDDLRWEFMTRDENFGIIYDIADNNMILIADIGTTEPEDKYSVYCLPENSVTGLSFSTTRLPDWRVRAALCLVADREFYISEVLKHRYTIRNDFYKTNEETDFVKYYLQEAYPDYDLSNYFERCKLAGKLLEEAEEDGFNKTKKLIFRYYAGNEERASLAENIRLDILCALDLQVTLKEYTEWEEYQQFVSKGKYDIAMSEWPQDLNLVFGKWKNDEYKNLAADDRDYPFNASRILFSENGFPALPIYEDRMYCALAEGIRNVGWSEEGYFLFTNVMAG